MKNIQLTVLALIALTLSLPASAQFKKSSSKITNKAVNLKSTSPLVTNTKGALSISRAFGSSNEFLVGAADVPISRAPALSDFRLWYNNGDHKVRTIGILHDQGAMHAKYSDQNGDDPFHVDAKWVNIPESTGGTVTAAGAGTFNIQLPVKPANTTLVISGFSFERLTGTDNNIRTMSIKMDQENSLVQVSFLDDQREDYRSIVEPTMTGGVLGLVPFGAIVGSAMSMESIIRGIINEGKNTARPYAVTIQYAYIPNSRIIANGSVSGTGRNKSDMRGQIPNSTPLIYRGFVLRFNNSDHHLLGMGLHLNGMAKFPGQRGREDEPITWQDNNRDDTVQWFVDYSSVK